VINGNEDEDIKQLLLDNLILENLRELKSQIECTIVRKTQIPENLRELNLRMYNVYNRIQINQSKALTVTNSTAT